jgi:hypothetical protein
MVLDNKPPRPPAKPFRPSSKSHDDIQAVEALDAAESRLRAMKIIADDEAKRSTKLQEELDKLKAEKVIPTFKTVFEKQSPPPKQIITQPISQLQTQPIPTVISEQIPEHKPISISPQALTLRGKQWKVAIPLTIITFLLPLIWTLVSDYMQLKRDFKTQTDTYGAQAKRIEEVDRYAHEVAKSNEDLRESVAQLSGYISGVLPMAGVKVTKTDPGSAYVNIVSDPPPIGQKRPKPFVVHTAVPAPSPKP